MNVGIRILAAAPLVGSLAAGHARARGYKFITVNGPAPNLGGTHLARINDHAAARNFNLVEFPGASATAGVVGISHCGTIVGNDFDASAVEHGLVAIPQTAR
jgi:hypothetical protein